MFTNAAILIVDDDPALQKITHRWLREVGYRPLLANDGREAFALLKIHHPALILLDIAMPEMSGLEVLRRLRETDTTTAVIMVTGLDEPNIAKNAIALGIHGYLIKPFEKNELLIYIEHTLQRLKLERNNREYRDSLEAQVRERTSELERVCRDLKASQEQLLHQERLATIGHLAAGVAHEINNPTGYIGSNLGALARYLVRIDEYLRLVENCLSLLPEEKHKALLEEKKERKIDFLLEDGREIIADSLEGVEKIRKIVAGLKSFTRKEQDACSTVNINECLENALTVAWNELKYKAEIKKEYGDLPLLTCHPNQLGQVFVNLLVNAAHAIEGRGTITIRTFMGNDHLCVAITDTGCGISLEMQEKIFEPFFTTKGEGVGTGLGLSIVREIITRHEGEIVLESEIGRGTTFTVRIPLRRTS
ncbi:MAG: hybrid sensor histidine kinase/response regulator [Thermodesulfobacteriota bacterium]